VRKALTRAARALGTDSAAAEIESLGVCGWPGGVSSDKISIGIFARGDMSDVTDRKERTHQKMLDSASRQFRSRGYAGIGVAGIAEAADVTTGAFYAHFGSKEGAFAEALGYGLDEVLEAIPRFQREHGERWIEAFVDYYLSREHRADLECGCAMTTLSPEVARASPDLQSTYRTKMRAIAKRVAHGLNGGTEQERVARAWSMLSLLIGGLTLARAVGSPKLADGISAAVKAAARNAMGG